MKRGTRWYAVLEDENDSDWGFGAYRYQDAVDMALEVNAKIIAEIDMTGDPICIREYHEGVDF